MRQINLMDEWSENTGIGWRDISRKKLNKVIRAFNDWQINHFGDVQYAERLLTMIAAGKETFGAQDGGSGYFDELVIMENEIRSQCCDAQPLPLLAVDELNENSGIERWDRCRKQLNVVVRAFNRWQIQSGRDHGFGYSVLAKIDATYKEIGEESDEYVRILEKMKDELKRELDL